MTSQTQAGVDNLASVSAQADPELPDSGIVLVDMSCHPIASDPGAVRILASYNGNGSGSNHPQSIPEQVVAAIRAPQSGQAKNGTAVVVAGRRYRCRSYLVHCDTPPLGAVMVAVHFDSNPSGASHTHGGEGVREIAAEYHLTVREEEALRGIAAGLTTKELADRMGISPNTVKCFVRLIMSKMRVTTRGAIMVKLLEKGSAD